MHLCIRLTQTQTYTQVPRLCDNARAGANAEQMGYPESEDEDEEDVQSRFAGGGGNKLTAKLYIHYEVWRMDSTHVPLTLIVI